MPLTTTEISINTVENLADRICLKANEHMVAVCRNDILDEISQELFGCNYLRLRKIEDNKPSFLRRGFMGEALVCVGDKMLHLQFGGNEGVVIEFRTEGPTGHLTKRFHSDMADDRVMRVLHLPDFFDTVASTSVGKLCELVRQMGLYQEERPLMLNLCSHIKFTENFYGFRVRHVDATGDKTADVVRCQFFDEAMNIHPGNIDNAVVLSVYVEVKAGFMKAGKDYHFTFKDLCDAKQVGDNQWKVRAKGEKNSVTIQVPYLKK